MVVPAAVKQMEAESDAALEEFEQQVAEQEEEVSALEVPVEEEPIQPTEDEEDPNVTPEEEPPVVEEQGVEAQPVEKPMDYEQMYKTLKGKYNAEVPRLQHQLSSLQEQMTEVLTRPAPTEEASTPSSSKGPAFARYLKKEEIEDYGEEILSMQARMAEGVAEGVLEKVVPGLANRIEYLESLISDNSASSFWDRVEQHVPNARQMNDDDPLWHLFLEKIEPNSGLSYQEIGDMAFNNGDSGRMVTLLKAYLSQSGVSVAGKDDHPVKKEAPPVKPGKVAKKSERAPSKAKGKIYRESEVKKFYDDQAKGLYKGREEEAKKLEREIELAFDEGRIVK